MPSLELEAVARRATKISGINITPQMVEAVEQAKREIRAENQGRAPKNTSSPVYIRCVCGCGKVFQKRYAREKIHPDCRKTVYANRGLMAILKHRRPEVVEAEEVFKA